MDKKQITMPGERLATEEEYAAGRNTKAIEGKIVATTIGTAEFDDNNKEVRVKGKSVKEIREGDIITGRVMLVKESTAVITLLSAENGKKITGVSTAQLPIRNISNQYVTELRKTMRIGDLIRARVTMASELAVDLSTKEKGLGVIKAYCSNCRSEMNYAEEKLNCPNCGNTEERKWFEAEDNYVPRQGGFERREGFGGGFRGNDRRGGFGGRSGGFRGNDRRGGFGGGRERNGGFGRGPSRGGHSGGFNRGPRREGSGFGERRSFGNNEGFGGERRERSNFERRSFDGPRRQEF